MTNEQRARTIDAMTIDECKDELAALRNRAQRGIGDTDAEFEEWAAMLERKNRRVSLGSMEIK